MIRLFEPTATSFGNNGIGALSPISCRVTEELNGEYEAYLQIAISSQHFADLQMRSLIEIKPNPFSDPQIFRVYRITKPLNGVVSVYARHLAYDLSGIVVTPYTASDIGTALAGFSTEAVTTSPFTFETTRTTAANFHVDVPSAVWSLMGGQSGSILDVYGGEYEFDNYTITVKNQRGSDNGVTVRYGKNMTSLEQDTSCAECYTGAVGFWSPQVEDGEETETQGETVYGNLIYAQGTFDYTRIMPLDLSEHWETQPTVAQIDAETASYIERNKIGVPDVNWKVEFLPANGNPDAAAYRFIPLNSTGLITTDGETFYANSGASGVELLETVLLGDTMNVYFEKLGVNARARVVKTEYDALQNRYKTVELGRVKSNLADTIVAQQKEIEAKPSRSVTEKIAAALSKAMMFADGGSVRLRDTNGDGEADELYIADNPNPLLAQKVWRFNYLGWAVSQHGYNGPFTMGATIEDGLLAEFVTAANLKAGIIQSADDVDGDAFYLNLNDGVMQITDPDGVVLLKADAPNHQLIINTPNFGVDANGNATFSGNLNGAGGTFSGNLSAAGGTFSGNLVAAGGTFSGTIEGADLVLGGANNVDGTLTLKNASGSTIATLNKDGLSASRGTFSGALSSPTGTIGGWTIGSNQLYTNNMSLNAGGEYIEVGSMVFGEPYYTSSEGIFSTSDTIVIEADAPNRDGDIELAGTVYADGRVTSYYTGNEGFIHRHSQSNRSAGFRAMREDTGANLFVGVGAGGTTAGLYSQTLGKWIVSVSNNGAVHHEGIYSGTEYIYTSGSVNSTTVYDLPSGTPSDEYAITVTPNQDTSSTRDIYCYVKRSSSSNSFTIYCIDKSGGSSQQITYGWIAVHGASRG